MLEVLLSLILMALIIIIIASALPLKRITVFEYERGLKYVGGRYAATLAPGHYWIWKFTTTVEKIDVRPSTVTVPGQEVLSSDGLTLKVSLAAIYEIADPNVAVNKVQSYHEALYLALQVAARQEIGSATMEELLQNRSELGQRVQELAASEVEQFGLRLISASIKDIMLPGDLKRIFAQTVKARNEGLAALEKARGETAALRNLANAARMVEDNPALMQLRMLHSMTETSGNTFVVGVPPANVPLPVKKNGNGESQGESEPEE